MSGLIEGKGEEVPETQVLQASLHSIFVCKCIDMKLAMIVIGTRISDVCVCCSDVSFELTMWVISIVKGQMETLLAGFLETRYLIKKVTFFSPGKKVLPSGIVFPLLKNIWRSLWLEVKVDTCSILGFCLGSRKLSFHK